MRKSFVLLLALVILVSGTACYAQNELLQEKDQVHFEEKVIYGDKSVVEGVTVEMDIHYDYHLFWNTLYKIGTEPHEETEYTFYPWYYDKGEYKHAGSIDFVVDCNNMIGNDYDKEKDYYGLDAAMKELYDQTAPGTENSTTVYLKDYVDYYTFGLDMQLPHERGVENDAYYQCRYLWERELREDIAVLEKNEANSTELKQLKKYLADMEAFQEFFKIPVLDTEVHSLAIAKSETGNIIGMGESSMHGGSGTGEIEIPEAPNVAGADAFSFRLFTAFDDGDCYLTFDPHTLNDKVVDVSQIPGGYGIYHFTYDEKEGTIDLDNLEMVYALDINTQWDDMILDASGKNILLFTCDEENHYMSVIDRETLTLVDTFKLGDIESYFSYWSYEDYLVVKTDSLMVFPLDENGRYFQAFSVDSESISAQIETATYNYDIIRGDSCFDWNGKTLLIANNIVFYYEIGDFVMRDACDFYVAAIDETGLLYFGEYYNSLDTSDVTYNPCQPHDIGAIPITVRWN